MMRITLVVIAAVFGLFVSTDANAGGCRLKARNRYCISSVDCCVSQPQITRLGCACGGRDQRRMVGIFGAMGLTAQDIGGSNTTSTVVPFIGD